MGNPPGTSYNYIQIQYHFKKQRNNYLHCFIWDAEKKPKTSWFSASSPSVLRNVQ